MRSNRPTRSVLSLVLFSIAAPFSSLPEYTRKYDRRPTKGSETILKTNALKGAESSTSRTTVSFVSGSIPVGAGISSGEGR